ncbi:putative membrane protein [Escherichia coli DEC4B]|nr:putative membrane protein [Shigella sonnei 53G]EHU56525.1 putative membrane protein [Escherichia coli DEC3B]EHU67404.1 putative membrane protein [Escherichia coli DEC3C]EHU72940.1 putative membrane protein [Escherichia coli DEC3E]EHU91508.1 putative membrane protein [Escherichia coli DEC4B]EHW20911.1 putative membrane protein [Escherichia coli DEC8D]EHW73878.1 putative membrane protein [Escherichia coli DEC10D]EHY12488.1 putative membrane protein [Escherichia coli DEC15D]EIQ68064.1 putat
MRLNDFFYNRLFILNFCLFFRGLLFLTKAQPGKKPRFFLSPFATTLLAVASWHSVNAMYIAAKKMMK